MKAILSSLPIPVRTKIYLIVASSCIILLFYSIHQSAPIIVESGAMLGFGSYLHPTYWVGLGALILCSVFAFIDSELKRDFVFLFILVVLGLYLIGMTSFVTSLPREPAAYYPTVVGEDILSSHHLNITGTPTLLSYSQWPATQLLSANLLAITDTQVLSLIRYAPVFWALLFTIIIYSFGKRLGFPPNLCFALGFLALASWFTHQDFSPQGIAMLLYLLALSLLIPAENTWQKSLLVMLAFASLTITHSLTPIAVIGASALVLIYTRRVNLLLILIVAFFTWYIYQASLAFEQGIQQWWRSPFQTFLFLFSGEKMASYAAPAASVGRTFWRACQLSYAFVYLLLFLVSGFLFLKKSIGGQQGRLLIILFLWLVGTLVVNVTGFWEGVTRTYMYALIPLIAFILIAFSNRKILKILVSLVMLVTIALNMPAHYGAEASWSQVLLSELSGNQFFAQEVKPTRPYFAHYLTHMMFYSRRDMLTVDGLDPNSIRNYEGEDSLLPLNTRSYVLLSKQGHDAQINAQGEDIYQAWPETDTGREADLIYNNRYFQIYKNQLIE